MKITIIGAGRLGTALATRFTALNHQVTLVDRDTAGTGTDADLVVLALRYADLGDALKPYAGELGGTVVWSCVNALTPDLSALAVGFDDSAAERVARLLPGARVVAALPPFADAVTAGLPPYQGHRAATFVCGDDPGAKAVVIDLLTELGADAVDSGALTAARLAEPAMLLLVRLAYAGSTPRDLALGLLER